MVPLPPSVFVFECANVVPTTTSTSTILDALHLYYFEGAVLLGNGTFILDTAILELIGVDTLLLPIRHVAGTSAEWESV